MQLMSNTYSMNNTVDTTNSIAILEKRCEQLEQQVAELLAKNKWLEEQFRLGQQRRFGASSERSGET